MWILAAKFEIRQRNVSGARRLLGQALGMCPKAKLFKSYIELELTMGQVERWVLGRAVGWWVLRRYGVDISVTVGGHESGGCLRWCLIAVGAQVLLLL